MVDKKATPTKAKAAKTAPAGSHVDGSKKARTTLRVPKPEAPQGVGAAEISAQQTGAYRSRSDYADHNVQPEPDPDYVAPTIRHGGNFDIPTS